jgi:hypothetical protein
MSATLLRDFIEDNVQFVARALCRIESGETPETDLHNLRIFLLDALDLIEPDSRTIAAADDLYRLASECAYEQEREVLTEEKPHVRLEHMKAAREALLTFREALLQAQPRSEMYHVVIDEEAAQRQSPAHIVAAAEQPTRLSLSDQ